MRILHEETGDEEVGNTWRELRYDDDDRVTDLALDAFRKFNRSSGKNLIFMVENINRLLERQIKKKSQIQLLRKIFIEDEWLVTLFTTPTYLGAVTREEEPLFEFFQVEFLPELSSGEQREMLQKLTDYENNDKFKEYLAKYQPRLKALYHFTGGNPRLTMMLYDLITRHAITDVQAELDGLLDRITPFYQDRMKDIGEQEGKLIETMALMSEGRTPMELAMESRLPAKTIRAVLQRLVRAGNVKREVRRQKKTVYIIPERLFRIWHQMNHSRASRDMVHDLFEFFSTCRAIDIRQRGVVNMERKKDIRTIASMLKSAGDEVRQIETITSQFEGFDIVDAYEVAHLIHETRLDDGAVPVGRKIGFTNPDMWSLYGVNEPIWGYIYDATVVHLSPGSETCGIGRFTEPKIEPEIVFHFRSAPPMDGDLPAILECIDWVAHAFEIVQSHYPGWKFQAADTVADSSLHGTLLVGEPRAVDDMGADVISSLELFSLSLSCNGEIREVGRGSNVLGNPLAAIAHLIHVLAKQPKYKPLRADEIVTTGTITTARSVRAGETWRTELEGIPLPGLSVEFVA